MTPKEFQAIQLRHRERNHVQMNYIKEVIAEARQVQAYRPNIYFAALGLKARLEQAEQDIDALLAAVQPCLTIVFGDVE